MIKILKKASIAIIGLLGVGVMEPRARNGALAGFPKATQRIAILKF